MKLFRKISEYTDTGFSSRVDNEPPRLVNQDGSINVTRTGLGFIDHFSFFHELVKMGWTKFNVIVLMTYAVVNIVFGFLYWIVGVEGLGLEKTGSEWQDFLSSFYFSAQTFSTVGYGRVNPVSVLHNFIAIFEMLVGMMYIALAAGLLFARFSRPVSKVVYSRNAIIAPYQGGKGLMFRVSNAKKNMLLDVSVRFLLTMKIKENGNYIRKFYELNLERSRIDMLAMSWTIVHPIGNDSPLFSFSKTDLDESDAEFLVLISGTNDTFSQAIHSRTSYKFYDVVWDVRFDPIFEVKNGKTIVKLDKIDSFSPAV